MSRVVFFGTPSFAARILRYLLQKNIEVVAIVTQPDRPQKRSAQPQPSEVKILAQEIAPSIPLYQPIKASEGAFVSAITAHRPDFFVVAAYGQLLKASLLDIPRFAPLNVHTSLLPRYRGAAPIQRALMNGEIETGVAIMKMVLELDAGDVVKVAKTPIPSDFNAEELEKKLADLACPLVIEAMEDYKAHAVQLQPQDPSLATYAPKITPEECRIDWSKEATVIHNQIRALSPKLGAWALCNGKRIKIFSSQVVRDFNAPPGHLIPKTGGRFVVGCGVDAIEIFSLQLEGKRRMSAAEMLRGSLIISLQ